MRKNVSAKDIKKGDAIGAGATLADVIAVSRFRSKIVVTVVRNGRPSTVTYRDWYETVSVLRT